MSREDYFKKILKYKELIFGYSSLIGLIFTITFISYSIYKNNWNVSFILLVVTLALINGAVSFSAIYSINLYHKLSKKYNELHNKHDNKIIIIEQEKNELIKKLELAEKDKSYCRYQKEKITSAMHNILHESRKLTNKIHTFNLFLNYILENYILENYILEYDEFGKIKNNEIEITSLNIEKSFSSFMLYSLDNIKTLFDILTGEECYTCIKLILIGDEEEQIKINNDDDGLGNVYIKTYMRDSFSYRQRNIIDERIPTFKYHENTAFQRILEAKYPDSFFMSNNLKKDEISYRNYREDWSTSYNACLVVPIRIQIQTGGYSIIGFMCVDNMHGGFNNANKDILAGIGDHFFNLFQMFSDVNDIFKRTRRRIKESNKKESSTHA